MFLELLLVVFGLGDDSFAQKFLFFHSLLPFILRFLPQLLVVFDLFLNLLHPLLVLHEFGSSVDLLLLFGLPVLEIILPLEFLRFNMPLFFDGVILLLDDHDLVVDLVLHLLVLLVHEHVDLLLPLFDFKHPDDASLVVLPLLALLLVPYLLHLLLYLLLSLVIRLGLPLLLE